MIAALILATALLSNARVNDPAQTPAHRTDLTPAVAVAGNEVVVVWWVAGPNPTERLRYARSSDGGVTYTDQGWLPNAPTGWYWGVDPCIEIDPITGLVFVAAQALNPGTSQQGIALLRGSLNSGVLDWATVGIVRTVTYASVFFGDNLSMHFDPATQSLDLVVHDPWATPATTSHQVSHDGGLTWSAPTVIATGPHDVPGHAPRVAYSLFGPIAMVRESLSPDQVAYRTRRWMSPPGAFEPSVTIAEQGMDGSSLPGTGADSFNGHTIAVDRTPWPYQHRIYAAWVGSSAFSSNPIPPGFYTGEIEPNDFQMWATMVDPGTGYFFSSFSSPEDVDWYSVSLAAGEHLVIRLNGMEAYDPRSLIRIATWTPGGFHELGVGSFKSGTPGNSIRFTAPRAAVYGFKVTGVDVAAYGLSFARANQEPWLGLDRRDLYTSFSTDLGQTWSSPARLGTSPGFDVANPQLVVGNDGRPYLFYYDFDAGHPDGATSVLKVTRSSDGGVTWETPITLSTVASEWQTVANVGTPYKIGHRIGAATMLAYQTELAADAPVTRAAQAASEELNERMVVVWPDARDGQTNLYSTSFSTGFDIPFRITDTTVTAGTTLGLRAIMQNRNTVFPLRIDPLPATCQRNWSSVQATFFLDPGETRSFWPIAVNIPDTAAVGDVFFQGAFTIGTSNYGINVMIHVVPVLGVGDAPRAIAFRTSGPNPASSSTRFDFTLPADAEASLEVFDVAGARVRTLVAGRVAAGAHEQRWDLSDDAGRRVGTGLYLARLTIGEWSSTRRITVVR